jgi:hypothetical protein
MTIKIGLKAIMPIGGNLIDDKKVKRGAEAAMRKIRAMIKFDFEGTTGTWQTRVGFQTRGPMMEGGNMTTYIFTNNRTYELVEFGARPHPIVPRRARYLRFRWAGRGSYRAKSRPGSLQSYSGGATGPMQRRKRVYHPGFEGRHFAKTIERKRTPDVISIIQQEIIMEMLKPVFTRTV